MLTAALRHVSPDVRLCVLSRPRGVAMQHSNQILQSIQAVGAKPLADSYAVVESVQCLANDDVGKGGGWRASEDLCRLRLGALHRLASDGTPLGSHSLAPHSAVRFSGDKASAAVRLLFGAPFPGQRVVSAGYAFIPLLDTSDMRTLATVLLNGHVSQISGNLVTYDRHTEPGTSGGPWLDSAGHLVGFNVGNDGKAVGVGISASALRAGTFSSAFTDAVASLAASETAAGPFWHRSTNRSGHALCKSTWTHQSSGEAAV